MGITSYLLISKSRGLIFGYYVLKDLKIKNKMDKTDEILKLLIHIVKDMKYGTDCGSEFYDTDCVGCKHYRECITMVYHQKKCNDLLKMFEFEP
jgi:hypothetical protein